MVALFVVDGTTRKVSAYLQLASLHLNVTLMKESQGDDRYKTWVKKFNNQARGHNSTSKGA